MKQIISRLISKEECVLDVMEQFDVSKARAIEVVNELQLVVYIMDICKN